MSARVVDPGAVADSIRQEVRSVVEGLGQPLKVVGFLVEGHGPSTTYAEYTRRGAEAVGVQFDLRVHKAQEVERAVRDAGGDDSVHGILIYYPVRGTGEDSWLRELVDPRKDVEGLHAFWARCLYENRRFVDAEQHQQAILPCTPLAVLKLLEHGGVGDPQQQRPLQGRKVCIFNRSSVVGLPLAAMMANDGAEVVSFDIDGALLFHPGDKVHEVRSTSIERAEALADADIVVTGVPSRDFPRIRAAEIRPDATCLNFSTIKNYDEDVLEADRVFIPRVGPMTVTMVMRNAVRLYQNFYA